jgi:hypothetical protein
MKWLPMTAAACFLIMAMVLILPAVMQENVPFAGEEEAEFITAEHEIPAVIAAAEILYADSGTVVLAVTLEFSEPTEDFAVDDVFASWVTNGFYSAGESVTMTPYSAIYVYSIFGVDREISVGDIFTKTHTGTHNGEAWEAKASVTVSRLNNEDLIITDEITLNPYHIRFITNEPDLIGDPYDTTIYFKTHCGNVFNTRDDSWYSFNTGTEVLHRVAFTDGFGVHDIASVILNGGEITIAEADYYTRIDPAESNFILPISVEFPVSEWHADDGGYSGHSGIDFGAPRGTAIYAVAGGTVIHADWQGPYGRLVIIEHENGLQTWYAHCSEFLVTEGQEVTQGELIALVGDSGAADGAQLHFEVRDGGGAIILNPRLYLSFE